MVRREIIVFLLAMPLMMLGCNQHASSPYYSPSGNVSEYRFDGTWYLGSPQVKLVHLVFYPKHSSYNYSSVGGVGMPVSGKGVAMHPDGLYSDGVKVETNTRTRVFVYGQDHKMRPIVLDESEIVLIRPESMETLPTHDFWTKKILPVLEREEWK